MIKSSLNQNWTLRNANGSDEPMTAQIPLSIYDTYLKHGKMEDPYWRANEMKGLAIMEDCVSANINALRAWGGGYYYDDYF